MSERRIAELEAQNARLWKLVARYHTPMVDGGVNPRERLHFFPKGGSVQDVNRVRGGTRMSEHEMRPTPGGEPLGQAALDANRAGADATTLGDTETWAKTLQPLSYEDRVLTFCEDGSTLDAFIEQACAIEDAARDVVTAMDDPDNAFGVSENQWARLRGVLRGEGHA